MVRHLDDVDRFDAGAPPQPALRGGIEVPEEHARQTRRARRCRGTDREHDARVVAVRGVARPRPEHAPREGTEQPRDAVVAPSHVHSCPLQVTDNGIVRRSSGRPGQRDVDVGRDLVHGADVVAVEVRQHEQVDPVDAEQVQARAQSLRVVPGVHQRGARPVADEDRVPLADVARRDRPVAGEPGPDDRPRDERRCDADHPDHRRDQQHPGPECCGYEHRGDQSRADRRGRRHAEQPGGPRHRGERQCSGTVRDGTDGRGRRPGDRRDDRRSRRPHGCEQARAEPEHGDHRRERLGDEVRGHRIRRERGGEWDRQRPARHLRGDRHGQRRGDRRPAPSSQHRGHGRSEHDDAARGEDRQPEREGTREPGVDDEHPEHGEADQRDAPHRTPREVHDQDDDGHHGRPEDRRVRTHQHDEPEQQGDRTRRSRQPPEPGRLPEHDDERDDHRAVRSRDGGEVGERTGLHGGLRRRVQPAPVPDRETAEQRPARLR